MAKTSNGFNQFSNPLRPKAAKKIDKAMDLLADVGSILYEEMRLQGGQEWALISNAFDKIEAARSSLRSIKREAPKA